MPKQVRLRRGTTAQHATFTGADGEVTFDTTKKVLVLHDGVTAGGKPLEGFVVLTPGNPMALQTINGLVSITGGDDDTTAFSVVHQAAFNDVVINALASIRRLHVHQEQVPYSGNIVLNFGSFGSKRVTLTGNAAFSAVGYGYGYYTVVRIQNDGTARNMTWPGWKFVGGAAPASLAANKTAILHLWCFGLIDAEVVAQYVVEP
jgi:hypothetical protein